MSRYRGLIIVAFLALMVSALVLQRSGAQNGKERAQSKGAQSQAAEQDLRPQGGSCTETTTMVNNTTPVAIVDNTVVMSTVNVAGAGAYLNSVDLTTFITHTFAADIDMTLTSPVGTVVTITSDNGGSNDNVFNGTVWSDKANPGGQVPYATNNGVVTDTTFVNLTTATPLVPEEHMGAFRGENPNGTWTLRISDDGTFDTGSLASWSLALKTVASAPTINAPVAFNNTTPAPIPDNGGSVTSNLTVSGLTGSIETLTAVTNITHTFNADLQFTVKSPAGTIVTLSSGNGGGLDNVFAGTTWDDKADPGNQVPFPANTFAGSFLVTDTVYTNLVAKALLAPEEALNAFKGEAPNGTWTLTAADTAPPDTGTVNSWGLNITTNACSGPGPTPTPNARFWTSAGSTGTVDEDSRNKLKYQDFTVRFQDTQTGTGTVRYNITAVDGISRFCTATQSTVKVRFRNSDATSAHSRVKFEIRRTAILTGGNTVIFTFDSNGTSTGNAFATAMATPAIDFDFATNIYWIEATIFRDNVTQFADLGSIEIFESVGTPCS